MDPLRLYLGNRNYSSWSLRAWLAAKQTSASLEVEVFDLADPGVRERLAPHSPSLRVPALQHGDVRVWDSLAIFEYLAETFPAAGLWPDDRRERAAARSICAEMHAGFLALRRHMPMNIRRSSPGKGRADGVEADIERITSIWRDCRGRFGAGGPFLFGEWTLADAAYAPVATRFQTYAVDLGDVCRAYVNAVLAHPAMLEWCATAKRETAVIEKFDL